LIFCFMQISAFSRDNLSSSILEEGKLLFRLEKASWYATDFFLENFKDKRDSIGGYLSYQNKDKVVSIFLNRYDSTKVLVRFTFDFIPKQTPLLIDLENKNQSNEEIELIKIRKDALNRINSNTDGFFKFYKYTSMNPIPIINENGSRVFVLTGPQRNGDVLIGNDYVLTYNTKNEFEKKEKLHNSLVPIPYKMQDKSAVMTMHSHILSDYITSTDICTLLLYKDYVDWKSHIVMSAKYVSLLNLETESLEIMTKEDYEKTIKK
jgi:hypothetical protein